MNRDDLIDAMRDAFYSHEKEEHKVTHPAEIPYECLRDAAQRIIERLEQD